MRFLGGFFFDRMLPATNLSSTTSSTWSIFSLHNQAIVIALVNGQSNSNESFISMLPTHLRIRINVLINTPSDL